MASGNGAECGQIRKERERGGGWGGDELRGRENQKSSGR